MEKTSGKEVIYSSHSDFLTLNFSLICLKLKGKENQMGLIEYLQINFRSIKDFRFLAQVLS